MEMKRFKYVLANSYTCHDVMSVDKKTALSAIRRAWKLSYYLTNQVSIWEADKNIEEELRGKRDDLAIILRNNPELCKTDF